MNNFLVDASIYGLPETVPDNPDDELLKLFDDYIENFNQLLKKIFPQEGINKSSINNFLKVNRFLLSNNDIIILGNSKLLLDRINKIKLEKVVKSKQKYRIHQLQNFIDIIGRLKRYSNYNKNTSIIDEESPKPGRIRILEEYVGINNIYAKENKPCEPDLTRKIKNKTIVNSLKRNIYMLAFLNKCIYKSSDITVIISSCTDSECNLDINIDKMSHNFNNVQNRIWISNGYIKNTNVNNIQLSRFLSIKQVLKDIKENKIFGDTLTFADSINVSYEEYESMLHDIFSQCDANINRDIQYYKNEYANTVFDCLSILDKLVKYYNISGIPKTPVNMSKNFNCDKWIKNYEICKICNGYLRVCGFNCSGENEEREIGDESYVIHLKPYSYLKEGIEKHLVDLTLRIYFKWDNGKIKIGWIGKHF